MIVPHEKIRTRAWQEFGGDELIVLADSGFNVSMMYGVAFQMRIHSDTSNTPGTFLIGRNGILEKAWIGQGKKNWSDRPDLAKIIEAAEAL